MEYKELSAKTVSEAITQACLELSVPSDRLDYEVISEGSKGFLGIGNKPAIIRYRILEEEKPEEEIKETVRIEKGRNKKEESGKSLKEDSKETSGADSKEILSDTSKEEDASKEERPKRENRDRNKRNRKKKDRSKNDKSNAPVKSENAKEPSRAKEIVPVDRTEEEIASMKETAADFLKKVFAAMELPVEIKSEYERETNCLNIELSGDDMGVLIGKRGQTLDSLQYLTSLCVNKNLKEYVRVKIDTEDYRRRRKDTLENLAKNIASKVKKTGKPVVLEPMNPYERRIIHSALQPNKNVETYSEGNEPYRHVVVVPKK